MKKVESDDSSALFDHWIEIEDLPLGLVVVNQVVLVVYFYVFVVEAAIVIVWIQVEFLQVVDVSFDLFFLFLDS